MALKLKLNKAAYDKLSDDLKKEYKADGEDFALDVEGLEDTGGLKRALENERTKNKTLVAEKATLENDMEEMRTAGGDTQAKIDAAVAKANAKSAKEVTGLTDKLTKAQGSLKRLLVDNVAADIANKLFTTPKLALPHIRDRIAVDMDSDEPLTVFLDANGKVDPKLNREAIEKEFVANPDFKGIVQASKANGGGTPLKPIAGGGTPQDTSKPANLGAMKGAELAAHLATMKQAAG